MRARHRLGRALAWLGCMAVAACESSAPVPPTERPEPEPPPVTRAVIPAPEPFDLTDLLISETCERQGNYLCAIEALARLVEGASSRETPARRTQAREPPAQSAAGAAARGEGQAERATRRIPAYASRELPAIEQGNRPARPNRQALTDRLWGLTAEFLPAEVAFLAQHHELAPLWRLREQMSGSRSAHEQAQRLRAWMNRQQGHPFARVPPTNLARVPENSRQAHRIGLFVPLSGALAAAGRAVRDGFVAAYLDDTAPLKPPLRIYDTTAGPIATIFERSRADEVNLIVGPLSKGKLEALHGLGPQVPVLGLNYLDAAGVDGPGAGGEVRKNNPFLQLGLAIEDEAATIAEHLLAKNVQRLLAIRSTEDWAVRGTRALQDTWPFAIELQEFTGVRTVTESVGDAMGVVASEERNTVLERLLNRRLEFQPRARSDLQGVVAFVDHLEATALAPALKYHLAGRLPPVYASSLSVRDASSLEELGGFQVAEMPFNLYADPLWDTVKAEFEGGSGNVAALRALGMDAWLVVSHWNWVAGGEPLFGATGRLKLEHGGQVRRRLAWASVRGGKVRPMTVTAVPGSP